MRLKLRHFGCLQETALAIVAVIRYRNFGLEKDSSHTIDGARGRRFGGARRPGTEAVVSGGDS